MCIRDRGAIEHDGGLGGVLGGRHALAVYDDGENMSALDALLPVSYTHLILRPMPLRKSAVVMEAMACLSVEESNLGIILAKRPSSR